VLRSIWLCSPIDLLCGPEHSVVLTPLKHLVVLTPFRALGCDPSIWLFSNPHLLCLKYLQKKSTSKRTMSSTKLESTPNRSSTFFCTFKHCHVIQLSCIILIFVMMSAPRVCSEPNTVALIPSQCVTNHYPSPIARVLLSAGLDPDLSQQQLTFGSSMPLDYRDLAKIQPFPSLFTSSTPETMSSTAHLARSRTVPAFGRPSSLPLIIGTNNKASRCPQFQLASKSSAFQHDTDLLPTATARCLMLLHQHHHSVRLRDGPIVTHTIILRIASTTCSDATQPHAYTANHVCLQMCLPSMHAMPR
jgi:hypothetical protein